MPVPIDLEIDIGFIDGGMALIFNNKVYFLPGIDEDLRNV